MAPVQSTLMAISQLEQRLRPQRYPRFDGTMTPVESANFTPNEALDADYYKKVLKL